jgi:hypothetical protein
VASGLGAAGVDAEPVLVQLFGSAPDASFSAMRARLTDVHFRGEIADALKPKLGDDALVLFPPILGETSTGLPMTQAFANECGVLADRFGEAIATAPALFGEAHKERICRVLSVRGPAPDLGGELGAADVHVFTSRAKRWLSERASHKVTFHGAARERSLGRMSIGQAWTAGYRAARALEQRWQR